MMFFSKVSDNTYEITLLPSESITNHKTLIIHYNIPLNLKRYNPHFLEPNSTVILDDIVILTDEEL